MHALNTLVVMQGFSGVFRNSKNMLFNLLFIIFIDYLNLILECKIRLFNEDNGKSKILFVDVGLHRCVDCIFSVS